MLQLVRSALKELVNVDVLRNTRAGNTADKRISLDVDLVHVLALVAHLSCL